MPSPIGPVFTGAFEEITSQGYRILFLPDRNNPELRAAGEPLHFYWVPGEVRIAYDPVKEAYKFHQIHFVGDIEEGGKLEKVVGGVLAFSTTSAYPLDVLKEAEDALLKKCTARTEDPYWYYNSERLPSFTMVPIASNITAITNLGAQPQAESGEFPNAEAPGAPNLDQWAYYMQGEGTGSVTGGENAYSGMLGDIPSQILWDAFHGSYSVIAVTQNLLIPMWTQLLGLEIHGKWERLYEHFSSHESGSFIFYDYDIKKELNNLITNGGITVKLEIDGTRPVDEQKAIQERIDVILQLFMEQATQYIFTPAPTVPPANIDQKLSFGKAWAVKEVKDFRGLDLSYNETRYIKYNQQTLISSVLEGFFDEISKDPEKEKQYFTRTIIGALNARVTRLINPVANWETFPINHMQCQLEYPRKDGTLEPKLALFTSQAQKQAVLDFVRLKKNEVDVPPAGWEPDMTFVKRTIEFNGSERTTFKIVTVEQPTVVIDPGDHGILDASMSLTLRVEDTGVLDVGPITLWMEKDLDSNRMVEVEFKPLGKTLDGLDRDVAKFVWRASDQFEDRYWKIITGDKNYSPEYMYKVIVRERGGSTWETKYMYGNGNGPFTIDVPEKNHAKVAVLYATDDLDFMEESDSVKA